MAKKKKLTELFPECPKCGPGYYEISYDESRIEEGILVVMCECYNVDCKYKVKHVFTSEWNKGRAPMKADARAEVHDSTF